MEKKFECYKKLTYVRHGGFGHNYRYCFNCFRLWEKEKEKADGVQPFIRLLKK